MKSKNAFKKCRDDDFAICFLDVSKGWIGIEPYIVTDCITMC